MPLLLDALVWGWSHPLDVAVWVLLIPSLAFVLGGCGLAAYVGWRRVLTRMARGL